jgi:hypothetical protein
VEKEDFPATILTKKPLTATEEELSQNLAHEVQNFGYYSEGLN